MMLISPPRAWAMMSSPGRSASGPSWPKPGGRRVDQPRVAAARSSKPRPRRRIAPGRRFSTSTSAWSARARKAALPSSDFRSRATERLPRLSRRKGELSPSTNGPVLRTGSPPSGLSTLTTSAPRSASCMVANGAAMKTPTSSTRTPASAPPPVMSRAARRDSRRPGDVRGGAAAHPLPLGVGDRPLDLGRHAGDQRARAARSSPPARPLRPRPASPGRPRRR